jgi:hypothetical protein
VGWTQAGAAVGGRPHVPVGGSSDRCSGKGRRRDRAGWALTRAAHPEQVDVAAGGQCLSSSAPPGQDQADEGRKVPVTSRRIDAAHRPRPFRPGLRLRRRHVAVPRLPGVLRRPVFTRAPRYGGMAEPDSRTGSVGRCTRDSASTGVGDRHRRLHCPSKGERSSRACGQARSGGGPPDGGGLVGGRRSSSSSGHAPG